MAHPGQEFEAPNGMRLRLVSIEDARLEMEAEYPPDGSLPPAHLHPGQDERFTVLEGTVTTVIDGREQRYSTGETFTVAAGVVHQMAGVGRARLRWEVSPALRTAEFFEGLYTGAAADDPSAFLARYRDELQLAAQPQD